MTATRDLLREVGYERLTIAEVAARAGVGKQTIYRWWSAKAAIVTDCVLDGVVGIPLLAAQATGDAIEDLRTWLVVSHRVIASPESGPLFRALAAAAAADAHAVAQLDERFISPLSTSIAQSLRAGIGAGQIRPDVDVAATADLLLGSLTHAIVTRDRDALDRLPGTLDIILRGLANTPDR